MNYFSEETQGEGRKTPPSKIDFDKVDFVTTHAWMNLVAGRQ
jgi:hypothetical protein